MRHRWGLVALLITPASALLSSCAPLAQTSAVFPPAAVGPSTPAAETPPAPAQTEESRLLERPLHRSGDVVTAIEELRGVVRAAPERAGGRLMLAQGLYRVGDLDAALDECRAAVKLDPQNAIAHLQLGLTLMARQDGRAAAAALTEATLLDPELTHAHYSLGAVQYSLGDLPAAIRSYRRALELRPDFPDARYRLALVLKLTHRREESAQLMEQAAARGLPQAQYFLGNAYRHGQGVERDLARAIQWWTAAASLGYQRATASLSQLRRQALSPQQPAHRRKEAQDAFRQYRDSLWIAYPDTVKRDARGSLGVTLLTDLAEASNAIAVLLDEALALSEPASDKLAHLYEHGLDSRLAPFDKRILNCFEAIAADGFIPAKKALARIYGKGLGVAQDSGKAKAMLTGLPEQEMNGLLGEILTR